MKRLRIFLEFTFLTGLILILVYLLSFLLAKFFTEDGNIDNFLFHETLDYITTYLLLFWILGITYKKLWSFETIKTNKFYLFVFFLFLVSPIIIKLLFVNKCNSLYDYIKEGGGYSKSIFYSDSLLCHSPIPYGQSSEPSYVRGEPIPVFIDSEGFRSSEIKVNKKGLKIGNLFLGCSFTWGSFCKAEETYPFLVSDQMDCNYINAGGPAYGLAQMYWLGKNLIPKYKPEYVFIQYSPWLADRNTRIFHNIFYHIDHPYPHFIDEGTGISFNPPPYTTALYKLPLDKYKKSPAGFFDKLDFYYEICYPLFFKEPLKKVYTLFKIFLRLSPAPIKDCRKIEHFVYTILQQTCTENNTRLIILNIGRGGKEYNRTTFQETLSGDFSKNTYFLDLDSFLISKLGKNEDYSKKYQFWHYDKGDTVFSFFGDCGKIQFVHYDKGDTVFTDPHPNPLAHKLMANWVLEELQKMNEPGVPGGKSD